MHVKRYEIRVPYPLSDRLAAAFPELEGHQLDEQNTVFIGVFRDQAELHALLARIAEMGLDIIEFRTMP